VSNWTASEVAKQNWFADRQLDTISIHETQAGSVVKKNVPLGQIPIYVCGITPYDSAHLGHAFTYAFFDVVVRFLRQSGREVKYVQNVTDVDDPLFERARRDELNWSDIAKEQTSKFVNDMKLININPPNEFVLVSSEIETVKNSINNLNKIKSIYQIESDWYFDSSGYENFMSPNTDLSQLNEIFAQRGGDPQRKGKRNSLDPVVWKQSLADEPSWQCDIGSGRPGWHIECVAIIHKFLSLPLFIQGGGKDLIFPHHTMCAHQIHKLTKKSLAENYLHVGMVGYQGEKMSKSLGNLVFISDLVKQGFQASAVKVLLLDRPWHEDWEYTLEAMATTQLRVERWQTVLPKVRVTKEIVDVFYQELQNNFNFMNIFAALDQLSPNKDALPGDGESVADLISDVLGVSI
jgi:L-cysteine:1D-myo-inositol 2-amino-2-deoxy-alpha-D-glucopyranoside ligase